MFWIYTILLRRRSSHCRLTSHPPDNTSTETLGWFSPESPGRSNSPVHNEYPGLGPCPHAHRLPCYVFPRSAFIASFCVASLFSSSNKLVVFSQFFSHVWMNLQYVSAVKAVSYTNLNIQYSDRVFLWSVSANDWHGNRLSTFEMSNRKNKKIISRKAFSLHPLSRILGKALMWVVEVFELLRLNK